MDARLLVRWLGADGAKAGMLQSKDCTVDSLKDVAEKLGIEVPSKPKRSELVDEIVRIASRRIDKPIEALFSMSHQELVRYFEEIEVGRQELLDLLRKLDVSPSKDGNRNLLDFVARELAETGMFVRIASDKSKHQDQAGSSDSATSNPSAG